MKTKSPLATKDHVTKMVSDLKTKYPSATFTVDEGDVDGTPNFTVEVIVPSLIDNLLTDLTNLRYEYRNVGYSIQRGR